MKALLFTSAIVSSYIVSTLATNEYVSMFSNPASIDTPVITTIPTSKDEMEALLETHGKGKKESKGRCK